MVDGKAQVSMNLTDFTRTPIARVVELIRREADRYGVAINHSELVGLIPQAALVNAAQWYLQLDEFEPSQVLETRLHSTREAGPGTEPSFLEQLAAGTATPGGGSAAAYTAAMAAGLVSMVARLTLGKKKYRDVENQMAAIIPEADQLRKELEDSVTQDSEAFQAVLQAYALPKENQKEQTKRTKAIEQALQKAADVPLHVASIATRLLELASQVAQKGNINAITEAGSAGMLAMAALQAAGMNVKINAKSTSDQASAKAWLNDLQELEQAALEFQAKLKGVLQERGKIAI
jgi:glutamate formiminotransferase/formiminotetrahydrofolate cyclodeaminase